MFQRNAHCQSRRITDPRSFKIVAAADNLVASASLDLKRCGGCCFCRCAAKDACRINFISIAGFAVCFLDARAICYCALGSAFLERSDFYRASRMQNPPPPAEAIRYLILGWFGDC